MAARRPQPPRAAPESSAAKPRAAATRGSRESAAKPRAAAPRGSRKSAAKPRAAATHGSRKTSAEKPRAGDGTAKARSRRTRVAPPKPRATAKDATPKLVFREVTAKTWKDFETLFEEPGAPKYCWCMAWRAVGEETKVAASSGRKKMMRLRVMDGTPVGLVGYADKQPVAWCSIAPRETYRPTMAEARRGDEDERVWSVVCFFIHRSLRRRGAMVPLIRAAKAHAKKRGATILEAYPVDKSSPSYRFGGFLPSFRDEGFEKVGKVGTRRHVVRLRLR